MPFGLQLIPESLLLELKSHSPDIVVDYVRLADGTKWGQTTTGEAKDIEARFKK